MIYKDLNEKFDKLWEFDPQKIKIRFETNLEVESQLIDMFRERDLKLEIISPRCI